MKLLMKCLIICLSFGILTGCGGEKIEHVLPRIPETKPRKVETQVIETEETQKETESAYEPQTILEVLDTEDMNEYQPFYGIWCFASKDYNEAARAADEMIRRGYHSNIFTSTDWSNLNTEKWFVVSAGIYESKQDAEAMLWSVQKDYPDAYVKYSGDWQG